MRPISPFSGFPPGVRRVLSSTRVPKGEVLPCLRTIDLKFEFLWAGC